MSEAFNLISALDLSKLSESDRQAATIEVRAQLDHIAESGKHDVETLARKVSLLKIWQKLVHLRVVDVARNVRPPFEKPGGGRLYPDASMDDAVAAAPGAAEPGPIEGGGTKSDMVLVRTLEEGVVQGMRLPAGVTVETSIADAQTLVSSGIGMIIQRADIPPDEEVTRPVKAP